MPPSRKNNPWYKAWKAIFKGWLYLLLFIIASYVLDKVLPGFGQWAIIPFYLLVFTSPLALVSFVSLFIMRENDRERERIRQYKESKDTPGNNTDG